MQFLWSWQKFHQSVFVENPINVGLKLGNAPHDALPIKEQIEMAEAAKAIHQIYVNPIEKLDGDTGRMLKAC